MIRKTAVLIFLGLLLVISAGCTKSEAQLASEALERGLEAHQAGNVIEAAANYRTVLRHDPANVFAYYNLGLIDHDAGRLFEAENNYRLSLSYDSEYAPALFNLALLRANAASYAETVDIWQRYISLRPNDASAHHRLSLALRELGRTEEADAELQLARQLDPSIVPASPQP